jgi:CheY-like chemotaxis protein
MTSLIKTMLEMDGFEVTVIPRGSQVLEKAHADPPDVFMIDFNLNDIDGVEVTRHLRQDPHFAKTPILMASGLDVEKEALAAGVTQFVLKPFEPSDLAEILAQLIR